MSFWCHRFDQNINEKIWQFLPKNLKSGEINKIKELSYNMYISMTWWYGLCNVSKSAFILWLDPISNSRARNCQIFHWYFGPNDNTKRAFWNYLTFTNEGRQWKRHNFLSKYSLSLIKVTIIEILVSILKS